MAVSLVETVSDQRNGGSLMTKPRDRSRRELARDRRLLRIGGLLAIVGALVTAVSQAMRPSPAEPGNIESYFMALLDLGSFGWLVDNLALLVGMVFVTTSFVSLAETLRVDTASAIGELGKAMAVIGAGLVAGTALVSGLALPPLVEAWVNSQGSQADVAFGHAVGIWWITRALFVGVVIVFFGFTYFLMGLAVAWSDRFPAWFGYVAVVSGAIAVLTGLLMAVEGQTQLYDYTVFPALALVSMLWAIILGTMMWRRVPDIDAAGPRPTSRPEETEDAA